MKIFTLDHYYDDQSEFADDCTVIYLDIDGKNVWEYWYEELDYVHDKASLNEDVIQELVEFDIHVKGIDEVLELARSDEEFE